MSSGVLNQDFAGIGKSMFLHYMTWRLRQIDTVKCVIQQRAGSVFLDHANEVIIKTKHDLPLETDPSRWILFDSTDGGAPSGIKPSVLVTSPKYTTIILFVDGLLLITF